MSTKHELSLPLSALCLVTIETQSSNQVFKCQLSTLNINVSIQIGKTLVKISIRNYGISCILEHSFKSRSCLEGNG